MGNIKELLKESCLKRTQVRFEEIQLGMTQAQESLESETKSSAGDKYETSREMIQQDLSRYQDQLNQVKKDLIVLQQIELKPKEKAILGAVVVTEGATYFLAISLGKLEIAGNTYMVISPHSPIGRLLWEKEVGEIFQFNDREQQIQQIF